MLVSTLFTLAAAGLTSAYPLDRRDVSLDPVATAQAQVRDNTATRAFTATTITTSDGRCLSVDPFSGDFRENLTPVNAVTCDGSKNQTWDVITSGVHNNVAGQALIVSSLTNACLNFDDRRAPGNQVLLFSCGGRADGSGQVTNSQLFPFNGGSGPIPLVPQSGNNQTCLTINSNNQVDQTNCNPAQASGLELFTFGSQGSSASDAVSTTAADSATTVAATTTSAVDCVPSTVTVTVTVTADSGAATTNVAVVETSSTDAATTSVPPQNTAVAATATTAAATTSTTATATTTGVISVSGAGGVLNPTAAAEANPKDTTATFAAQGVQIKDSTGQCLSVDATGGDFRENLIPIELKDCDGSEGQNWDFITKGVHNNAADSTLIVSSLTNGCLNFDNRRAAGDQVIMFSCGGRADGSGQVTNSQLFPFVAANLTAPYVLTPENSNNAVCFVNDNGRLGNTACTAASPSADQLFTISGSGSSSGSTGNTAVATTVAATTSAPPQNTAVAATTTTAAAATTTTATATTTGVVSVSGAGGVLNPTAAAEANPKDTTATFAAQGVQIKDSTGQCLSVDDTAGDFRENLIPIELKDCDGSEGQKWDFITKGVHNNAADSTLIVSSLTNGCLNFDDRRAAGDQVIMFSCGGRADGSGQVTNSQLFPFVAANLTAPYALTPENGNNAVCFVNDNGRLGNTACTASSPAANELFTIVN